MKLEKKKEIKLFNIMFPLWALYTVPNTWAVIIPANFILDSLVLIIAMFVLKMEDKKDFYVRHIFMVFCFGFLADIIAAIGLWVPVLFWDAGGVNGDSLALTIPGLILAGVLIFVFDYFISFRGIEQSHRKILSLVFAIGTAPYTFLIPSTWVYR